MSFRENAKIIKTGCLGTGVYEIWFETSDIAKAAKPGQFISVYSADGSRLLPRPISICAIVDNKLRIVYRTVGAGTKEFSSMKEGESLSMLRRWRYNASRISKYVSKYCRCYI